MVKSIGKLGGLGAGLYLANKMNKGTWGYIGFGILGYLLGGIVGGQISNVVLKSPDSDSAIPDAIKNTNNTNNTTTNTIENKDSKVVALFADMAANPPKSEQEAKDRAAKFGLTKDDITAYNAKQKSEVGVPTFDKVNSLVQDAMKKAGITPNAAQTNILKTAFDKWSVTQKKFAVDYMNGFFKVKALTPNTKAWNDAFTDMNNYLMKTYPDEKMKLEVSM